MITTARQLKDLIRNLSKKKSADAQILMRNYMMERFLERISLSEYKDQFILKGGMLVAAIKQLVTKGMQRMSRILLIEDDTMIASGITYALETEGYETKHATMIADAKKMVEANKFDLAIIDMQLPDGNGFDVSEMVKNTNTSVIFLTVVDDENTIVRAFDEGAQDYIVKPFRIRELLARVRRILSTKNKYAENDNIISIGQTIIHTDEAKVYVNDKIIELTALEYRLLLIFASNKGSLLSRQQILDKIWDADGNFVEDNTLTVYVKRLREKLGEAVNIETVRGMGYRVD